MSIFDQIKNFRSGKEAVEFIEKRLTELNNKEQKEIGLNTDTSVYEKFISPNVKVNVSCSFSAQYNKAVAHSIGSVKFDDANMYLYLVSAVMESRDPYEAVYKAINYYLVSEKVDRNKVKKLKKREKVFKRFSIKRNIPVSIKLFNKTKLSRCPEKAGAAQNMFKFLGIDSDYVINGYFSPDGINLGHHSFNVVYPEGRKKYAVIYDPSNECGTNYPMMYYIDERKRKCLFENKEVNFTNKDVSEAFKRAVGLKATLGASNDRYLIYKDGYPVTIISHDNPEIAKKLALKREL